MGETPVLKAETGDQVYYTGHSHNPEGGGRDRLVHGTVGKVTGRASGAHAVAVHFEGNHESIDCALDDLSKEPPPALPGGYKLDDELYFLGASQALETGDRLVHGAVGRVTGPAAGGPHAGKGLCMLYRGNDASVNCPLDDLSKDPPPPLLGGYGLGERLFFSGTSFSFASGDKLVYGGTGTVAGPAAGTYAGRGLAMHFDGNRGNINCLLTWLGRDPPPALPGGYLPGEQLYHTGHSQFFSNGDKLVHATQGAVTGPATGPHAGKGLKLLFPGNKGNISCPLSWLSRDPPPALPGGYLPGEQLYYTAANRGFPSGNRVTHGATCMVTGPTMGTLQGGEGLAMLFEGNSASIECLLMHLSRQAPPPLPGGYKPNDELFYIGPSTYFASGNRMVHGERGTVAGPALAASHTGKGLAIQFPGNEGHVQIYLEELSRRRPPPLPRGFCAGEWLYYVGKDEKFENGDRLVHGTRGEVTGPATGPYAGQGLCMLFAGNKGSVGCYLTDLSRDSPRRHLSTLMSLR